MGNVALNKPATASKFMTPFSPARAVNGSLTPTSRWVGEVPCWMTVDMGAQTWVNRWVVKHMGAVGWSSPNYNMCDFSLSGSLDNINWTPIDTVTNNSANVTDRSFNPVGFRYFKVNVTNGLRTNSQLASIAEVEIYDVPPTSQYLSALTMSSGTLNPAFNKTTLIYAASVGYDTTSVTFTPTAETPTAYGANAQIKVNGVLVPSGQASPPVNLNVGSNIIPIEVTSAVGGAKATYNITITRASTQCLTNLVVLAGRNTVSINPAFDKGTLGYTANVAYGVQSVTVTPTAEDSAATIRVNGTVVESTKASGPISLNTGLNNINVEVTSASGGDKKTYTIGITRASS